MSDLIITVRGEVQHDKESAEEMDVTSFYGGARRGPCLQFSINQSYIQLTVDEVDKLRSILTIWWKEHTP